MIVAMTMVYDKGYDNGLIFMFNKHGYDGSGLRVIAVTDCNSVNKE